jgi:diaminopimelate epimerase
MKEALKMKHGGTGATAVDSDECATGVTDATSIDLNVEGGLVVFDKKDNQYTNVYLKGPAEFVFKGNRGLN